MKQLLFLTSLLLYSFACFAQQSLPKKEICEILYTHYGESIFDINADCQYYKKMHLYWSDPGWVDGPDVIENKYFYTISFKRTTYNEDHETIRYVDSWTYYFPVDGGCYCYLLNRYNGKFYHGGSMKYLYGSEDLRNSAYKAVYTRAWGNVAEALYNLIFKIEQ